MTGSAPRAEKAREVLDWCHYALEELRQQPIGTAWIVRWFGTLALLRTVGEALENVDIQASPTLCKARREWLQKVNPKSLPIYGDFIDGDANALLTESKCVQDNLFWFSFRAALRREQLRLGKIAPQLKPLHRRCSRRFADTT